MFLLWADDQEVKANIYMYENSEFKVRGIPDTPYSLMEGQA